MALQAADFFTKVKDDSGDINAKMSKKKHHCLELYSMIQQSYSVKSAYYIKELGIHWIKH